MDNLVTQWDEHPLLPDCPVVVGALLGAVLVEVLKSDRVLHALEGVLSGCKAHVASCMKEWRRHHGPSKPARRSHTSSSCMRSPSRGSTAPSPGCDTRAKHTYLLSPPAATACRSPARTSRRSPLRSKSVLPEDDLLQDLSDGASRRHAGFLSMDIAPFATACRNQDFAQMHNWAHQFATSSRSMNDDILDVELGVQWLRNKARVVQEDSHRYFMKHVSRKSSLSSPRAVAALQETAWRAVGKVVDSDCLGSVRDLLQQFSYDTRGHNSMLSATLARYIPAVASACRSQDAVRLANLLSPMYPARPLRILPDDQRLSLYHTFIDAWLREHDLEHKVRLRPPVLEA